MLKLEEVAEMANSYKIDELKKMGFYTFTANCAGCSVQGLLEDVCNFVDLSDPPSRTADVKTDRYEWREILGASIIVHYEICPECTGRVIDGKCAAQCNKQAEVYDA